MPVHDFVVDAGVQRVPTVAEVAASPMDISCRNVSDTDDCTWKVLVDIVVDALGLAMHRDLLREFLEQDPELRGLFERLVENITTRNWSTVADLLDELLWGLTVGGLAVRFVNHLRGREVSVTGFFGRLALKIVVRLANILGWAYLTGSLLVTIKANAPRCLDSASDRRCP